MSIPLWRYQKKFRLPRLEKEFEIIFQVEHGSEGYVWSNLFHFVANYEGLKESKNAINRTYLPSVDFRKKLGIKKYEQIFLGDIF